MTKVSTLQRDVAHGDTPSRHVSGASVPGARDLRGAVVGQFVVQIVRLDRRVLAAVFFTPAASIAEGIVDVDAADARAIAVGGTLAVGGGDGGSKNSHDANVGP